MPSPAARRMSWFCRSTSRNTCSVRCDCAAPLCVSGCPSLPPDDAGLLLSAQFVVMRRVCPLRLLARRNYKILYITKYWNFTKLGFPCDFPALSQFVAGKLLGIEVALFPSEALNDGRA